MAHGLEFDEFRLGRIDTPMAPVLPPDRSIGHDHPVFKFDDRRIRGDSPEFLPNHVDIRYWDVWNVVMIQDILTFFAKVADVGLVHKGESSVGKIAANQFRLIFDNGKIASFAALQSIKRDILLLLGFLLLSDVAQNELAHGCTIGVLRSGDSQKRPKGSCIVVQHPQFTDLRLAGFKEFFAVQAIDVLVFLEDKPCDWLLVQRRPVHL